MLKPLDNTALQKNMQKIIFKNFLFVISVNKKSNLTILCRHDRIYKISNQKGEIKLSIKNELITLKQEKEELEKRLSEICSTLDNLYDQKRPIVQRVEALSTRTSSLAQTLLEKAQEELEKVNQKIVSAKTSKNEVSKELDEIDQNISEREDDFSLYIKEQAPIMISTFIEYIRSHLEDIGAEIQKKYIIKEVSEDIGGRFSTLNVPTGIIGIYDESKKSFIVVSKDFYFDYELYTIIDSRCYSELKCSETEWYTNY